MFAIGKRSLAAMLTAAMLVGSLFPATATAADSKVYGMYTGPDNIEIVSFSPNWADLGKLEALHDELLQNVHGDEIKLLQKVEIDDDYPKGKGVAGQYYFKSVTVFGHTKMEPGRIELYGGSDHTSVASFAHTLSHEYGHHVTHYYTLQTDGFALTDENKWQDTTYARMRGLSNNNDVAVSNVAHRWQIAEIAAEDYVQLFGSPLAKAETKFDSRVEQALRGDDPGEVSWNASMYNVQPQENLSIPLASSVPGLYDFFYKQMKGKVGAYQPPAKPQLKLESYSKQGNVGYQLQFSWTEAGEGPKYNYTLVTYRDNDLLAEPIVTRTADELHEARYGPVVVRRGNYIYTYQEPTAKGIRHFKLLAFGDNGWVSASPVLTVDLANPSQVTMEDQKVVPVKVAPASRGASFNFFGVDFSWIDQLMESLSKAFTTVMDYLDHLFFG